MKRLPTLEADLDNLSNEEAKGSDDEKHEQKFLDFTIDLEGESAKDMDPADSQLYVCNESNDSDEEAEANNVLNDLNELILNINQNEKNPFEASSGSIDAGIEEVDSASRAALAMPRTASLLDSAARVESIHENMGNNPTIDDY